MIGDEKIVFYDEYCSKCKYYNASEASDVCNECLNNPVNVDSHKPINYEEV